MPLRRPRGGDGRWAGRDAGHCLCQVRSALAIRPPRSPARPRLKRSAGRRPPSTRLAGSGHGWGPAAEATFRRMLTVPGLYDAFHYAALRTGNRLALQADAASGSGSCRSCATTSTDIPSSWRSRSARPGASAVSTVAARYPSMRHIVFCTDASPHRLWIHPNVDLYLVTSAAAEPAVHRFQPEARVLVIPPPVRARVLPAACAALRADRARRARAGPLRAAGGGQQGRWAAGRDRRRAGQRRAEGARRGRVQRPAGAQALCRRRAPARACRSSASPTGCPS